MSLVILDLDETLVHSCSEWIGRERDFIAGNSKIFLRPYVREFITEIEKDYELGVWTASYGLYTEEIIDNIFSNIASLQFVWDRNYCERVTTKNRDYFTKNIQQVYNAGYKEGQFIIVDDQPENIVNGSGSVLGIKPYYGSANDTELKNVLTRVASAI